jgi:ABC-type phosphate transport system substrate-binding protein
MSVKSFVALWLVCLAGMALIPRCFAQAGDIAVVVNPNSTVANVSLADLHKMFSGEKQTWPGGVPIKLIVRAAGCRERLVLLKLVGMSENEYKRYWAAQVLRGEAEAEPFTVPSFGMAKEAVKAFPGAITLVDAQDVKPGMKVIKLDGLLPGASGYPLH